LKKSAIRRAERAKVPEILSLRQGLNTPKRKRRGKNLLKVLFEKNRETAFTITPTRAQRGGKKKKKKPTRKGPRQGRGPKKKNNFGKKGVGNIGPPVKFRPILGGGRFQRERTIKNLRQKKRIASAQHDRAFSPSLTFSEREVGTTGGSREKKKKGPQANNSFVFEKKGGI